MDTNEKIDSVKEDIEMRQSQMELQTMHYHGDKVRSIFLTMAVIMLIMTPIYKDQLPMPAFISILGIIVFSLLAGLTNPKLRFIITFNLLASIASAVLFGKEVISSYENTLYDLYFLGNLVLAAMAVFAIYFSSKTFRGNILYKS